MKERVIQLDELGDQEPMMNIIDVVEYSLVTFDDFWPHT
jgi:hypothetical protein